MLTIECHCSQEDALFHETDTQWSEISFSGSCFHTGGLVNHSSYCMVMIFVSQ